MINYVILEKEIYFSYFQIDPNYYLFFYGQTSIDIDLIEPVITIIEELDRKQRKLQSLRGFFLYALETMENGKDLQILRTNLQPFFWRKVKNIIRQNKKAVLLEFLFGNTYGRGESYQGSSPALDPKIQNLQNQVNSLQDRIRDLETTLENSRYALRGTLEAPDGTKIIQQGDSTLEGKKAPYLTENDPKRIAVLSAIRNPAYQTKDIESKSLLKHGASFDSEASKIDFKHSNSNEQYNLYSNQKKGLNQHNFITLSNLSEDEKIEIIKTGFKLNQEGKISLKKYYESTQEHSLFHSKGYQIKYETIRRTKLYQQLKE